MPNNKEPQGKEVGVRYVTVRDVLVQATASSCQAWCPSHGFAPRLRVERRCGSLY